MGKGLIAWLRERLAIALPDEVEPPQVTALVERVVRVGLAFALAALAVQTIVDVLNQFLAEPYRAFDVNEDGGIFSWPALVATFTAGFAALLLRLVHPRWQFTLMALLFAFFSFDDFFGLHERVGRLDKELGIPEEWNLRYLWTLVFLPLFGVAATVVWLLADRASANVAACLRAGIGLLGLALVLETISPALVSQWAQDTPQVRAEILIEENAELVGWILIATGLTALACRSIARGPRPA